MVVKLLAVFCIFISTISNADRIKSVTIAVGEWSPYISKNLPGFGPVAQDVLRTFAKENVVVEFKWYPWKRAYILSRDGNIDATVPWGETEQRREEFYFSEKPLTNSIDSIFYIKGKPIVWSKFQDLKGYSIGGTLGYSYSDEFDHAIQSKLFRYSVAKTDLLNLQRLLAGGRIDGFVCNINVCNKLIRDNFSKEDARKFAYTKTYLTVRPHYLLVSKKSENGLEIINLFDKNYKGSN